MTSHGDNPARGCILDRLRVAALIAMLIGAAGSLGLMLRAGERTPRFLLVLFVIWVLSPFVALAWANVVSKRWSILTRVTLHSATLVVTLFSLAVYVDDAPGHRSSRAAFVYVAVPPASWLLIAIVVLMAAFIAGKQSRRDENR
jgi:hypothetical protein